MSNRLFPAALVLLLVLASCGGAADPERPPEASPAASPAPVESLPPSPEASPTLSPSPSPEPSLSASPSPPPGPSPSPIARPPAPAPPAPAPAAPPPPPGAGAAQPGTYTFNDSGQIRTLGCFTNNQPVPPTSRLTVNSPVGNRQQIDRDQTGNGAGFSTKALFEYRAEGTFLVVLNQRQSFSNQTVATDFDANPPVLVIPGQPTVGQTGGFLLTSRDGRVRIDTSYTVEALDEPVTLGQGAVISAQRIATSSRITGQSDQGTLNITIIRTSWFAPTVHLEVKDRTVTNGTVGLCRVDFEVSSVAQSV